MSKIVYYIELWQDVTDPETTSTPYKRLGPFDAPIAYTYFGTFENGRDDETIGLHVNHDLDIEYRSQPDDEELKILCMVRIVAEVVNA